MLSVERGHLSGDSRFLTGTCAGCFQAIHHEVVVVAFHHNDPIRTIALPRFTDADEVETLTGEELRQGWSRRLRSRIGDQLRQHPRHQECNQADHQ